MFDEQQVVVCGGDKDLALMIARELYALGRWHGRGLIAVHLNVPQVQRTAVLCEIPADPFDTSTEYPPPEPILVPIHEGTLYLRIGEHFDVLPLDPEICAQFGIPEHRAGLSPTQCRDHVVILLEDDIIQSVSIAPSEAVARDLLEQHVLEDDCGWYTGGEKIDAFVYQYEAYKMIEPPQWYRDEEKLMTWAGRRTGRAYPLDELHRHPELNCH